MVNRLLVVGDKIAICFKYEPRIINVVRELDGRTFNAEKKQWEVPSWNVVAVVDALKPFGFQVRDPVWKIYNERKRIEEEAANVEVTAATYDGSLPLYDFQKVGASFIRSLPASLLADVPGLGKTLQTAAAYEQLADPILVFCPASLKFNWHDEIKKWLANDKVLVVHGSKQERREIWFHAGKKRAKWVIANYELLLHDLDIMPDIEWGAIVCDEADRIANPFAKTTKALKSLKTQRRLALTGTPISNTPEDLWSITDWLYPKFLGTYKQFRDKYLKLHPQWDRVIGYQNLDVLREKMEKIMLRRKKEEVLKDFPAKTVEHVHFELSREERQIYDSVRKGLLDEVRKLTDLDTRSLALLPVRMLRLKQATDHTSLIEADSVSSSKLATLIDMLEPIIKSGEKAIVFTQFASMAAILQNELAQKPGFPGALVIKGDVDALDRKMIADRFQNDPTQQILIMTEAGAYGLNLQAASYVFHYDAPWSVAKIEQREGRAHRVGQTKPVTVYHLIARRTIDEYVLKVLKGKQGMADEVLGDEIEKDAASLSREDVEEILEEEI